MDIINPPLGKVEPKLFRKSGSKELQSNRKIILEHFKYSKSTFRKSGAK
jgi:hypothetical protein